jgi:hypothetical protein
MSRELSFFTFLVINLCVLHLVTCVPVPQSTSSEEGSGDILDTRDIVDKKTKSKKKDVNKNKDEEDNDDIGGAVIDIFGGVLQLVSGALDAAEDIAGNEDVQESVSSIVDVGLKSGTQAAIAGAQVAQSAPSHFEEKGNFAAGLTKTVEETGGLLTGSIDELEQGAKLFSVFAQAYTDITLKRIENFSKTFNKRFKCNTECTKLEDGTDEKMQCEKDYYEGFVKPKTKEQQEEEELKKLAEQYDYDYSDEDYDDEEDS